MVRLNAEIKDEGKGKPLLCGAVDEMVKAFNDAVVKLNYSNLTRFSRTVERVFGSVLEVHSHHQ